MVNAVAYLRVSGTSQLDGTGFDRQLQKCRESAADLGYVLVDVYREEAVSGTVDSENRPAFGAMIEALLDSGTKVIMVESLDRLARMFVVQEQTVMYLAGKGLTLVAANTGEDITAAMMADPMKKAIVQMQGIFAELDKSMTVAKLRKGRQLVKAAVGRCEGVKPFGEDPKRPDEAATLTAMRSLRAQGRFHHDIASELTLQGFATRSGAPWNSAVIARILRRETAETPVLVDVT